MSFLPPCSSQLKRCLKALVALSQAVVLCKLRDQSSALSIQEDGGCQENKQGFFCQVFPWRGSGGADTWWLPELHVREVVMNSFFSHLRFIYFTLLRHLLFPLLFPWARGEYPLALGLGSCSCCPPTLCHQGREGLACPGQHFCSAAACGGTGSVVCSALGTGKAAPTPGSHPPEAESSCSCPQSCPCFKNCPFPLLSPSSFDPGC